MSISDNQTTFLYKKNLGVVDTNKSINYSIEQAGNARPRIISNTQLFSQSIPITNPADWTSTPQYVTSTGSLGSTDYNLGKVTTSLSYPYLQYVENLVLNYTASKYAFAPLNPGTLGNINLLSNAIPFNHNPANTTWAYKVTSTGVSGNVDTAEYIVDPDAGYLYFVNVDNWIDTKGTPSISFYRYNGTIGIPTNIGSFAGAYNQGPNALAYGNYAGYTGQGIRSIAIGTNAGQYGQGTGSIAIGYLAGPTGMTSNSIALNASGTGLYATGPTGGFFVAPVGSYSGSTGPYTLLAYGADNQIVTVTGTAITNMGIVGGGGGTIQTYTDPSSGNYTASYWKSPSQVFSGITKLGMSSNGAYQLAVSSANYSLWLSNDNGYTWTNIGPNVGLSGSGSFNTGSISSDGKYILVGVSGGYMYLSKNSGSTFTNVNTNTPDIYLNFETLPVNGSIGGTSLTVNGTPTLVSGVVGSNAIKLSNTPPTASQYIRGTMANYTSFSVSLWFNLNSLGGSQDYQNIYVSHSNNFAINMYGRNLYIWYGGNVVGTSYYISTNIWYNVYLTFNANGTGYFYVNNTLVGTYSCGSSAGTASVFCLGTNSTNQVNPFNGYIDDVKIYNGALPFNCMVPMNYSYSAISGTGQYMSVAVSSGGLFMSANYGSTWSQVMSGIWSGLALSDTGQYMVANGGGMTSPNCRFKGSTTTLNENTKWTSNGVTWISSASSIYSNSPNYNAWVAFDTIIDAGSVPYSWASYTNYANGSYNTPKVNSTAISGISGMSVIYGEWIQLQSSVPLSMYSYNFACGGGKENIPQEYYIIGSLDGISWYPIQKASIDTNPFTSTYTSPTSSPIIVNQSGSQKMVAGTTGTLTITTYVTTPNLYTYFRFIATSLLGGTSMEFTELSINFTGGQNYSTNYGTNWTNTLNTYVPNFNKLSYNTWQTPNGVIWTSSASTNLSSNYPAYGAFNNFLGYDGATIYSWAGITNQYNGTNGAYSNNVTTTITGIGSIPGDWIQIKSSIPLTMYSYTYGCGGFNNLPKIYYIVGSLDGTIWYPIQYCTMTTNPLTSNYTTCSSYIIVNQPGTQTIQGSVTGSGTFTTYSTTTNAYTYFRCIFCNVWSNTVAEFGNWYINFTNGSTQINSINSTTNLLSLSPDGQYAIGSYFQKSIVIPNYLDAFTKNLYNSAIVTNGIIVAAACSNAGSVMVLVTSGTTDNVYYSTNYGVSFKNLTIGTTPMTSCAISYDGSYITVSNATTIYTLNTNSITNSVTLGLNAGQKNQGANSIAIGAYAGQTDQSSNSIILNASGSILNSYTNGFYVSPIVNSYVSASNVFNILGYGSDNQVVKTGLTITNSTQVINGEWIQLQLANPVSITSYAVYWRYDISRIPYGYTLLGSNDQIGWTILDTRTVVRGDLTNTVTITLSYIYYRLVITQVNRGSLNDVTNIGSFILYNNSSPILGVSSLYTLVDNTLTIGGKVVCTVTCSWIVSNIYGAWSDNANYTIIATSDNAHGINGWAGFYNGSMIYNSSGYAYQGAYTIVTTSGITNANISGVSNISGNININGGLNINTSNKSITSYWSTPRPDGSEYICCGIDSYFLIRDSTQKLGGYIRILDVNKSRTDYPTAIRDSAITFGTICGDPTFINGAWTYTGTVSEKMRIDCYGNVGIGTTSPSYLLDVNGTARFTGSITISGDITTVSSQSSGTFEGSYQYIKASGVSLGAINNTVSQIYKGTPLVIQAGSMSSNSYWTDKISTQGGTLYLIGGNGAFAQSSNNGAGTTHQYGGDVVIQGGFTNIYGPGQDVRGGHIYFNYQSSNLTDNSGFSQSAYSNAMFINGKNGNVGIGTTNPSYLLDVNGTARFTGSVTISGGVNVGGNVNFSLPASTQTDDYYVFNVNGGSAFNGDGSKNFYSGSIRLKANDIYWGTIVSYGSEIYIGGGRSFQAQQNHSYISFKTANTERVRIYENGNFGIGTTSPTYLLDVNGTARFTDSVSISSVTAVNGLDIKGSTSFDGLTKLRLYNPASKFGRTQLQMIGRYQEDNDGWHLDGGRNNIIFGYQTSLTSDITNVNAIQSYKGQLGFFSSGYSITSPAMYIDNNGNATFNKPIIVGGSVYGGITLPNVVNTGFVNPNGPTHERLLNFSVVGNLIHLSGGVVYSNNGFVNQYSLDLNIYLSDLGISNDVNSIQIDILVSSGIINNTTVMYRDGNRPYINFKVPGTGRDYTNSYISVLFSLRPAVNFMYP